MRKLKTIVLIITLFLAFMQATSAYAQTYPITIQDDVGRNVTIPSMPNRIISLGPSSTEILFALGLDDRVIGVTSYCDYPPEVESLVEQGKITVVGGFSTPNVELIISLNPDLILGHTLMGQDNLKTFEDKGIPVLVLDPHTIDDIYKDIEMIGKATGSEDAATSLINAMKSRIDRVKQAVGSIPQTDRVRVVQMCWLEPIWISGGDTFINAAIETAGGINVFSDISGYKSVNAEAVIERNPDIIIYTSMGLNVSANEVFAKIRELFAPTNAVKENKIYLLLGDAASMLERSGPGIVDGVETLAKIFYPSIYGGEMPHLITERKVSVIQKGRGYSEEQVKTLEEAKRILTLEGNIKVAYEKLLETGIITTEISRIPEDSPTYKMLIEIYGENLEKFPTIEGRIQLLYAMGKLEIEVAS